MSWEARTTFPAIGVGARLCIYPKALTRGLPMPMLTGDHPLPIQVGDLQWIEARIEAATATTAILVAPGGVRYQISPQRPGERDSGITLPGMPYQDWIVRSVILPG